jgi:hypothetical protein
LPDELDPQENNLTPGENESPKKPAGDDKSQSLSSVSSDEELSNKTKEKQKLRKAADEIQNDLNNLTALIREASQTSTDQNDDENSEHLNHHIQKKPTFDEDDDTSKQATQDYDLHDNEQEVCNCLLFCSCL